MRIENIKLSELVTSLSEGESKEFLEGLIEDLDNASKKFNNKVRKSIYKKYIQIYDSEINKIIEFESYTEYKKIDFKNILENLELYKKAGNYKEFIDVFEECISDFSYSYALKQPRKAFHGFLITPKEYKQVSNFGAKNRKVKFKNILSKVSKSTNKINIKPDVIIRKKYAMFSGVLKYIMYENSIEIKHISEETKVPVGYINCYVNKVHLPLKYQTKMFEFIESYTGFKVKNISDIENIYKKLNIEKIETCNKSLRKKISYILSNLWGNMDLIQRKEMLESLKISPSALTHYKKGKHLPTKNGEKIVNFMNNCFGTDMKYIQQIDKVYNILS